MNEVYMVFVLQHCQMTCINFLWIYNALNSFLNVLFTTTTTISYSVYTIMNENLYLKTLKLFSSERFYNTIKLMRTIIVPSPVL